MDDTTVSINGGPEISVSAFKAKIGGLTDSLTAENLELFFSEIDRREDERKEIATEIKEAFNSFCSSTHVDIEALKMAYKLHAALNKDRHKAATVAFEYDKLTDLLLPAETWVQERLI
jgi:uncharacterized protein (UPF0335 family)